MRNRKPQMINETEIVQNKKRQMQPKTEQLNFHSVCFSAFIRNAQRNIVIFCEQMSFFFSFHFTLLRCLLFSVCFFFFFVSFSVSAVRQIHRKTVPQWNSTIRSSLLVQDHEYNRYNFEKRENRKRAKEKKAFAFCHSNEFSITVTNYNTVMRWIRAFYALRCCWFFSVSLLIL